MTEEINTCPHCHYPIDLANPSGHCNHVYYPANCKHCKHLAEKRQHEAHKSNGILWRLKNNGLLHKVHLYADLSISAIALIGLFFSGILEAWFQFDMFFHIIIFVVATGGIIAERVLHKNKHHGMATH